MADPITGAIVGAVARLAPEVLKFFDRKGERAHELALGAQQQKLIELQSSTRLAEINAQSESSQAVTALEALRDSIKSQATATGIKIVDALSALVRPLWTYLVLLMWATVKFFDIGMAVVRDLPWEQIRPIIWGGDDAAMLATLSTFWFLDRVIRKRG